MLIIKNIILKILLLCFLSIKCFTLFLNNSFLPNYRTIIKCSIVMITAHLLSFIKYSYVKMITYTILHPFLMRIMIFIMFYSMYIYFFNVVLAEQINSPNIHITTRLYRKSIDAISGQSKMIDTFKDNHDITPSIKSTNPTSFMLNTSSQNIGLGPALKTHIYPRTFKAFTGQTSLYHDASFPIYLKNLLNEHYMIFQYSMDDFDQIKNGLNYVKNKMPPNFWSTSETSLRNNSSTFNQFIEHLPKTEQGLRFGASLMVYNNLLLFQQTNPGFQVTEEILFMIYNDVYTRLQSWQ